MYVQPFGGTAVDEFRNGFSARGMRRRRKNTNIMKGEGLEREREIVLATSSQLYCMLSR
jgi:hypothetical protein